MTVKVLSRLLIGYKLIPLSRISKDCFKMPKHIRDMYVVAILYNKYEIA
jgi:hypothetical protein